MNLTTQKISRKKFLEGSAAITAAGLFLACLPEELLAAFTDPETLSQFNPNVYIGISSDNVIRLVIHRSEMGNGARTSMAMLLAEELEAPWEKIKIIQAVGDAKYNDQNTDGSTSVRKNWDSLRRAGAAARMMLEAAAAARWGVNEKTVFARNGEVHHRGSSKKLSYGALAIAASKLKTPKKLSLKSPQDYTIIGTPRDLVDVNAMVTGSARYGIDVEEPGMLHASLERSPRVDAEIVSFNGPEVERIPGVVAVVSLPAQSQDVNTSAAVAVVADSTWTAMKARKILKVRWSGGRSSESTDAKKTELQALVQKKGKISRNDGDIGAAMPEKRINAEYFTPYLVHAPMEPPNAFANVTEGKCHVIAPTQQPQRLRKAAAKFLGINKKHVTIEVSLLGGGFGRKSQPDFAMEAVALSQRIKKPVKITWTREDEVRHGTYHTQCMQRLDAGLNKKGNIETWRHRTAFPTLLTIFAPGAVSPAEFELAQGINTLPYRIPNIRTESYPVKSDVRIGWLRSVLHIPHSFAINCFLDEIAVSTKRDPVQMRLDLLGKPRILELSEAEKTGPYKQDTGRLARVIKRAAKAASWGKSLPKGKGLGFASHYSFFSYVAMAIEVAVNDENEVTVDRVHCAVDCGTVVNPDTVTAQIEGAVSFGLSLALFGEITLKDGVVQQSNFDDYVIARMKDAPEIIVDLVDNGDIPTGVGEPGTPPVAPALYNAIYAATGTRLRSLPLASTDFGGQW